MLLDIVYTQLKPLCQMYILMKGMNQYHNSHIGTIIETITVSIQRMSAMHAVIQKETSMYHVSKDLFLHSASSVMDNSHSATHYCGMPLTQFIPIVMCFHILSALY